MLKIKAGIPAWLLLQRQNHNELVPGLPLKIIHCNAWHSIPTSSSSSHTPQRWPPAGLRVNQISSSSSRETDRFLEKNILNLCITVCDLWQDRLPKAFLLWRCVTPSFLFQHATPPFFPPFSFKPSFPSSSVFPGLCRGFHLSGRKLLLNFTLCSLLKCADFSVFAFYRW